LFLSLSTSAWILIAAGATLFNLVAMQWVIQIPEYRKIQFLMPVLGIVCIGGRTLAQGHTQAEALFVYAALIVAFPLTLAPVRSQLTRDYYRRLKDPTAKAGKGAMTWITLMMIIVIVVSAVCVVRAKNGA
jgi:hypothetical protein